MHTDSFTNSSFSANYQSKAQLTNDHFCPPPPAPCPPPTMKISPFEHGHDFRCAKDGSENPRFEGQTTTAEYQHSVTVQSRKSESDDAHRNEGNGLDVRAGFASYASGSLDISARKSGDD